MSPGGNTPPTLVVKRWSSEVVWDIRLDEVPKPIALRITWVIHSRLRNIKTRNVCVDEVTLFT